uniref:PABS domain-containing protein n=1 Tax=Angiostrongylus cantonensis TaxID=6313 RepID=A0A0K0DC01_ANGCA
MDITTVELDPAILRIAKKWYALDEDYRHRVIIDDGLNYVKCAAESVVHLDICTTDPDAKSLCPIDIFFTEEAVRVLSKLISERGILNSKTGNRYFTWHASKLLARFFYISTDFALERKISRFFTSSFSLFFRIT